MIERRHLETILRINGLDATATDDSICSVLLSSRYTKEEVEEALVVLRQAPGVCNDKPNGLHKVFRSDEGLKSIEISQLLGGDLYFDKKIDPDTKKRKVSPLQLFFVSLLSVFVAVGSMLFYMYTNEMGLFHSNINLVQFNEA